MIPKKIENLTYRVRTDLKGALRPSPWARQKKYYFQTFLLKLFHMLLTTLDKIKSQEKLTKTNQFARLKQKRWFFHFLFSFSAQVLGLLRSLFLLSSYLCSFFFVKHLIYLIHIYMHCMISYNFVDVDILYFIFQQTFWRLYDFVEKLQKVIWTPGSERVLYP